MTCQICESTNLKLKTTRLNAAGEERYQYQCGDCNSYTTLPFALELYEEGEVVETFVRDDKWLTKVQKSKTFVVTSVQSNSEVDTKFLSALQTYCEHNSAQLLIVPIKYSHDGKKSYEFDDTIKDYLVENNFQLAPGLKLLGALKISATAENPLTGLNAISQGDSVIVGHNQLQMNTLPVGADDMPVVMTSTGTISKPEYSATKSGYKAGFNHANSAVVVEIDDDIFHIRHLNWDGKVFHDLDAIYTVDDVLYTSIEALVTGDEHAIFADPQVSEATYLAEDSICETLSPKQIVRHDLFDAYSISHHHKHDVFVQFAKNKSGMDDLSFELSETIDYVKKTSPPSVLNVIVASNHNDHLLRWLNECDPKLEPWNAEIYHELMYKMLAEVRVSETGADYPNPFRLYTEPIFKKINVKTKFLGRREVYKIKGIEVANHGDRGANGSRGSRKQFSQIPSKTIIGHSHSPGIEKGCYQVGTSSRLNLEYNVGPSSWLHTHCIIHSNGKRQLVNIIKGRWRRKAKK